MIGRITINIGDSLYYIVLSLAIVSIYNLGVGYLAFFGMLSFIPSVFVFLFSPYIDKIKSKKNALIYLQMVQIISVTCVLLVLTYELPVEWLFALHFLFFFVNTLIYPIQTSFVPEILDYNKDDINSSVNYMYLSKNFVDVLSNLMSSILLVYVSIYLLMRMDILLLIIGVLFFIPIKSKKHTMDKSRDTERDETGYLKSLKLAFDVFSKEKVASSIIYMEGILNGLTTMIMRIAPAYLIVIDVSVEYLGLVLAFQKGSEFLGVLVSPKFKAAPLNFFMVDYLISGLSIVGIVFIDNMYIKLILFSVAFFVIGISGNVYDKMIYNSYDYNEIGKVATYIYSLTSVLILISLALPMMYDNVEVLILFTGAITTLFGVLLLIYKMKQGFGRN